MSQGKTSLQRAFLRSAGPTSHNHDMAVGQNQWYHFGVGAPPILVYFSGSWDVHWGYGLLAHGHMGFIGRRHADRVNNLGESTVLTGALINRHPGILSEACV